MKESELVEEVVDGEAEQAKKKENMSRVMLERPHQPKRLKHDAEALLEPAV